MTSIYSKLQYILFSFLDSIQMDVDTKETHQGPDAKHTEESPQKVPVNLETNGSAKDSLKHNVRQKRGQRRSRSQTPQKKTEDSKTLHITLKKLDSELNGKEIHEETAKVEAEKIDNNVENDKKNESKSLTEECNNAEGESSKDKQAQKQKEEKTKKEETKKVNNKEKKEEIKKTNIQEGKEESKKLINQEKKEEIKHNQEKKETKKAETSKKETPKKEKKDKGKTEATAQINEPDTETVEMDPLVITDEADPELQFDENSDVESGKGSPVIPRCATRRSQTRNIPTPKTPKSVDQDVDSEKNSATHTPTADVDNDVDSLKTDNLNDSCEYMDTINLSTKAEVGSDATRLDYIEHHNSNFEESSYVSASREKSLSETLRGLSARRSIRPLDDYRRRVLRSNQEKSSLNMGYTSHDSVEQVSTGIKRKGRSITPEDRKKFKIDSPDTNSLFSNSFANIRNKFKSDLPSSTPKLLSYRDANNRLRYSDEDNFENGDDEKKSWCSIM